MLNPHAAALLLITLVTFYLYTRSWLRIEYVSLGLLAALQLLFYFYPYTAGARHYDDVAIFAALGHPALVAICCLMILGRGLTMTGALEPGVRVLLRLWRLSHSLGLVSTLLLAGLLSAFVNDTPVLVLMLPMLLSLAERSGYPVPRALMPVNFAILCGGMLTSIGTSTNLLVLSIAVDLGMQPLGIFSFTSIAFTAFLVALPYLWLVAPRLLPASTQIVTTQNRAFDARVPVRAAEDEKSAPKLIGQSLTDLARRLGRPLPVLAIVRDGIERAPDDALRLQVGDDLLLRDTPHGLRDVAVALGVELHDRKGPGRFTDPDGGDREETQILEAVIRSDSPLVGRTLSGARFATEFHVVVIGLNRGTEGLTRRTTPIERTALEAGDVLLLQGTPKRLEALKQMPGLLIVDSALTMPRAHFAGRALVIMGAVVALAAFKLLPIHVASFFGALAMLATGCVRFDGVGRALSLEVVLVVASSIALGQSLVVTGAAQWVAEQLVTVVVDLPAAAQLTVFMAFAALLTNFVSNAAAAAVGTPIAVSTANALGLPLEPFVLAILFGANLSFATPMAYQTNLLIMNAAGYRFTDFVRVGVPLVLLMLATLATLLVRSYGL